MYTIATLLYSVAIFVNHKYPNYFGVIGFVIFIISLLLFMPFMWDLPLGAFLQKVVEYCYFFWVLIPIYLVWSMVEPEKSTLTIQSKMTAA